MIKTRKQWERVKQKGYAIAVRVPPQDVHGSDIIETIEALLGVARARHRRLVEHYGEPDEHFDAFLSEVAPDIAKIKAEAPWMLDD